MAVSDWSTNPAANLNISGISIAEGAPAGNMNNAIRQIMADVRLFADSTPAAGVAMPKTGGAFTGPIRREGAGGYLHLADSANLSGRVFLVPQGSALPALQNGDIVLEWA